jgi:signal transduction histidine kinase
MSESHDNPASPKARARWLQDQRAAYQAEPCAAHALVEPARALLDQVLGEGPSDFAVDLAQHLAEMLGELWRSEQIEAVLDPVLPWLLAGHGALGSRIAALSLRCRMHLRFGRLTEALALLEPLTALSEASPQPADQAHRARVLGQALSAQREWRRAIDCMREALQLAASGGDGGRWVDLLVSISVAHRALGEPEAQLAALREGARMAEAQRRWIAAVNSWSGVAEESLAREDEAAAEAALQEGRRCLALAGPGAERIVKELRAAEALLAARRGEFGRAAALMQEVVAQSRQWSMRRQVARRIRQSVPWLLQDGQAEAACAALEQAHGLELEEVSEAGRQDAALQLQRAELAHARSQQTHSEAHARELALKNRALEQALALQRELQAELLEAGKLASLGQLLAGMAHELNTPLGTALTALSTAADLSRALGGSLAGGAVSRSRFLSDLQSCEQGAELARRNVEQALALVQAYQAAGQAPDLPRRLRLDTLVRSAWERALSPGTRLCLELDAALELHTHAEALGEVLVQLFQNVERHAYAPGAPGHVRVQAGVREGQARLLVQDQGAGIAPELLPRVFDPYVSSQFGRGRSGLGLFIAQAAVMQRLRGRIRVESRPRQGCCFEIEWPVPG